MIEFNNKLNRLIKGQSIITDSKDKWVRAERSGKGKIIRFIRNTPSTFEVFKTCSFHYSNK